MKTFMNIKYLENIDFPYHGLERFTKTLEYQPSKEIQKVYKKLIKEYENNNVIGLSSELKPWVAFYIYNLIKVNNFHNILQIGLREGLDTLYYYQGLQENSISTPMKKLTIITEEDKTWSPRFTENLKHIDDKNLQITISPISPFLAHLIEKGYYYDCIIIRGNQLFDNALLDFFYADKLLYRGGVIVFFNTDFDSTKRVAKYVETNYKHYRLLPYNLGSKYCYTFVKGAEDSRPWFFHEKF
jgi:hypothetical protein